ncbi:unnamed protein product, partial [Tilletia controversa]
MAAIYLIPSTSTIHGPQAVRTNNHPSAYGLNPFSTTTGRHNSCGSSLALHEYDHAPALIPRYAPHHLSHDEHRYEVDLDVDDIRAALYRHALVERERERERQRQRQLQLRQQLQRQRAIEVERRRREYELLLER